MPLIVGTAGHIDHGKTSLVRALTGQDTDRLAEEKARGISIDLGFAWLDGPDGERAGIVDVPGHERFIRNMLAGAHGMDLVLFTVAADDGVMPQTEEHLDILHVLGVRRGIFVITKTDLVDARARRRGAGGDRDPLARHDARGCAGDAGLDRHRRGPGCAAGGDRGAARAPVRGTEGRRLLPAAGRSRVRHARPRRRRHRDGAGGRRRGG